MWYGNLEDLLLHEAIYLQWNRQKLEFGGEGGGLVYFTLLFCFCLNLTCLRYLMCKIFFCRILPFQLFSFEL